jgi:uncharacterized RDD family membrane protein YckC
MFIILGADEKEYGPVSSGQVRAWMMDGRADLKTRAKLHNGTEWKTLGDFPEFGGAVGAEAPPRVASALPFSAAASAAPMEAAPVALVPSASRWLRLTAALVDGMLKMLCWSPVSVAVFRLVKTQILAGEQPSTEAVMEVAKGAFSQALPLLALLALAQCTLLAWRSQSIGKLLFGLRIVRADTGEPGGFVHTVLLRGTVTLFLEQVPVLGFIFMVVDSAFIFSEDRRCLHDLIAGTRVIRN